MGVFRQAGKARDHGLETPKSAIFRAISSTRYQNTAFGCRTFTDLLTRGIGKAEDTPSSDSSTVWVGLLREPVTCTAAASGGARSIDRPSDESGGPD
jgi:hypothetical protein